MAALFKGLAINGRESFYDGIRVKEKGIKKFPGGNKGSMKSFSCLQLLVSLYPIDNHHCLQSSQTNFNNHWKMRPGSSKSWQKLIQIIVYYTKYLN